MRVLLLTSPFEDWLKIHEADLRCADRIFHSDPLHTSFGELKARHFDLIPIVDGAEMTSGLLLIPTGVTSTRRGDALEALISTMDRLLGPGGCPWDQQQTHESLKKYLLEEAYEVIDAIDSKNDAKLREELGDLLLQPIFHAQMKARDGQFDTADVADEIRNKLIRRHPHVFGDLDVKDAEEVLRNWDKIKQKEKPGEETSILGGIPISMPSLLRAYELSKRAVRVGFEWEALSAVFEKLGEELNELKAAIESGNGKDIEAELGDLLFTIVNIARWLKVEPEDALRKMLNRFTQRFEYMERHATKSLDELTAEEWDHLWNLAKADATKPQETC